MRVALAVVGLVSFAVGLRWLQLFIFTDYRAHLRHVLVPFGMLAVAFGLFMLLLAFRGSLRLGRRSK